MGWWIRVLNLPDRSRLAWSYKWMGRAYLLCFGLNFYYKVGCQVLFVEKSPENFVGSGIAY